MENPCNKCNLKDNLPQNHQPCFHGLQFKIQTLEKENKTLKEELLKAREYEFMYKELHKRGLT